MPLHLEGVTADNSVSGFAEGDVEVGAGALNFYTIPPCRVVDTRRVGGPLGGPALNGRCERRFTVRRVCDVPPSAKAIAFNLTVTQPTAQGHLCVYPSDGDLSPTSTIDYSPGQTRGNNGVVRLGRDGDVTVFCGQVSGTAHVVLDLTGYFK